MRLHLLFGNKPQDATPRDLLVETIINPTVDDVKTVDNTIKEKKGAFGVFKTIIILAAKKYARPH